MTEQEWLKRSDKATEMLQYLRDIGKVSDRKWRLYVVACWRRIWPNIGREGRRAVEVAERFADGQANESDLAEVYDPQFEGYHNEQATMAAEPNVYYAADLASDHVADFLAQPTVDDPGDEIAFEFELGAQCALVRELVGNPFRPVVLAPALRTPAVVALAQAMYEDRRFDEMPLLADALEEAGCTEEAILKHCREPGEHVRGCWVIDLILDKN